MCLGAQLSWGISIAKNGRDKLRPLYATNIILPRSAAEKPILFPSKFRNFSSYTLPFWS